MEPAATKSASPVSRLERESVEQRVRRLAAARRRATALLGAVTGGFIVVTAVGVHGTLLGYVQAGAEAAMVGGVADWFAVTALFRRPLGLPIPHTAVIVERKDQFAETLGQFVQENFLNADVLAERIRSAGPAPRLAAWLADEGNAARFAGHAADIVVTLAGTLRDEDVQRVLNAEVVRAVQAVEVAPLAGRAVGVMIAGGHHAELFNSCVSAADRYLADHFDELSERFEAEAPRWLPDAVYGRAFDRLHARVRERLAAMASDPDDEARQQFDKWIAGLPERLKTSPELRERGESIKRDLLASPGSGTGPRGCGRTPRRRCGPRRPTPTPSCAGGWPRRLPPPGAVSAQTRTCRRASIAWSSRARGRSPSSSTTSSPTWSPARSSAGTPRRPRPSWSCCSAVTSSSSGSTARWSAPASASPCTPSPSRSAELPRRPAASRGAMRPSPAAKPSW